MTDHYDRFRYPEDEKLKARLEIEENIKKLGPEGKYAEEFDRLNPDGGKLNINRDDLKWDKGKAKYHLILSDFLHEMAVILTKGEVNHPKYCGQPSWQGVEPEAYLDAMYRHIHEYRMEPGSLDEEMGTDHMTHVAVNAMFLWWFSSRGTVEKYLGKPCPEDIRKINEGM